MNDMMQGAGALVPSPATGMMDTHETAISAVGVQAKAMVESRYIMALRRPRDWDQVRQSLLKECRRPSFANNKSAFYRKPIGDGVEGLGIRFVEVALRCMTNVLVETTMIYEDADKEVHRVSVTDLEANLTYPLDVRVSKTVERSRPSDDGTFISVRKNSYGKNVYTVPATDDDLLNKRAALISKAVRTLGLRVIPGDLQDEAEAIIKGVRSDEAARDPDGERKRIADAFGELGVPVAQLTEYLGHDLGTCSPPELVDLRGIYGAIKDGEATWKAVIDNARERRAASATPTTENKTHPANGDAGNAARSKSDKVKDALKKAKPEQPTENARSDAAAAAATDAGVPDEASVLKSIERAQSNDDLDVQQDVTNHFPAGDVRNRLSAAISARREQLGA